MDIDKTLEQISNLDKQKIKHRDYENQSELFDTEAPMPIITDSDHEIVIELSMNLLSKNSEDTAALPETQPMYHNNYWIPLQSGINPEEYCKTFLNHFQNAITGAI
jgi:hypothetical protein